LIKNPDLKPPRPARRGEVAERSEAGDGLLRFMPEGSGFSGRRWPWEGSWNLPRRAHPGKARLHPRESRGPLFWVSAVLLLIVAYFIMAPDAPNLPLSPEQSESVGRTAY